MANGLDRQLQRLRELEEPEGFVSFVSPSGRETRNSQSPSERTDKTDKRGSVSFGSPSREDDEKITDPLPSEPTKLPKEGDVREALDGLSERGYVVIYSETLGCEVVWTVDRHCGLLPSGTVRYTLSELAELVKGNVEAEGLRMIHTAKELFDGRVTRVEGADSHDT